MKSTSWRNCASRAASAGVRWYAVCPIIGRRCTTLVLPPCKCQFAVVKVWGVFYGSQREATIYRAA